MASPLDTPLISDGRERGCHLYSRIAIRYSRQSPPAAQDLGYMPVGEHMGRNSLPTPEQAIPYRPKGTGRSFRTKWVWYRRAILLAAT
jgi:hypothetical protein